MKSWVSYGSGIPAKTNWRKRIMNNQNKNQKMNKTNEQQNQSENRTNNQR